MSSDTDLAPRRVPSLVSHCQRVLSAHADAITWLGDDVRYDVIKPVLECCSADTLLRLEQSSPYLEQDTADLWERLCFQSYSLLAEQLVQNADHQPESWRDQYFLLREAEAHRLEEVASKLRNQRMEAAERKKERTVKLTDRLPPTKRARTWGTPSQPKSLFQKTKNEATKLRRSLYTPRSTPQLPYSKAHHLAAAGPPVTPSTKPGNSRIASKAVPPSRAATTPQTTPHSPVQSANSVCPVSQKDPISSPYLPTAVHPQTVESRPSKPPIQKRDPMASLFMPKHRTLSQLPSQAGNNNRSVPLGDTDHV